MSRSAALLLLLACTPPEAAPATDTGSPAASEPDSAAGGGADSADTSAETGDTAPDDTGPPPDTGDTAEPEPASCMDRLALGNGFSTAPDYAAAGATVNSTCSGTDHQEIEGVQRVVFLGDSITVGTPPNTVERFYRNQVAAWAVARWGLQPPEYLWGWYDLVGGTGYQMDSGDFAVCAKYGGRTDDLVEDNDQLIDCIPEEKASLTTLVVMTVGGNDLFALADDYYEGLSEAELAASTEKEMQNIRDAITWLTTDKTRFPGRMYVVFANLYEFTDGFGEVEACPGAGLAGYSYDLSNRQIVERIAWMQTELLTIAADTGTDMIFMGEAFCGHGYNAADATGACYRGADAALWFDETCFHPNNDGHDAIAGLFESTIEE